MFRIALKSTLAKKLRLVSTALSVVIGVAFLTGTLVFNDTIRRTFDQLFSDVYAGTDAYVRSSTSVELGMGQTQRGRIPESLIDHVRGLDGVAEAAGVVQGFAQLVGRDGDPIGDPGMGPPTFGMNYVAGALGSWTLTSGSRPPGPSEVVVDVASAESGGLQLGDDVDVLTQTGAHRLLLVGTARFGTVDSPGGASIALFDLATAQQVLLGGTDEVDAIVVRSGGGLSDDALRERIATALPPDTETLTGAEITDETQDEIATGLGFFNTFLLVFAAIGLIVACFTIYNTFQIIVTQRVREMALLRAIGATRRQVMSAQLLEALFVGVVASVLGVICGVAVAALLKTMLARFGIDIPAGGIVFSAQTAMIGLVIGVTATVLSALVPSRRASHIAPLAAIRDVSTEQRWDSIRRLATGLALVAFGVAGFVAGLSGVGLVWVGIGALAIFVGVFVLGPLFARPIMRVLGFPFARFSQATAGLARQNAMRSPKRTARTSGALMVGVALVATITVVAASVKDWVRDIFDDSFVGDYVVSTSTMGFGGLSPEIADGISALPEVAALTAIRMGAARNLSTDDDTSYLTIDPTSAGKVFDVGITAGSVEALTPDGILIDDDPASKYGWSIGDRIDFRFLDGLTRALTVVGIYTADDLAGPYVIDQALHEQTGVDQFDVAVYIGLKAGTTDPAAMAAIQSVTDRYANAELRSRSEYIASQAQQLDPLVNLIYALLALAVVIALVNIANSMALSIHERTREIGLVRAVGMTRHQTRASIAWEAMLLGLFGTIGGLVIGVVFGWAVSVTIRDAGLGVFVLPIQPLAMIGAAAVAGGLLAAARPGRHAARINILDAIATV